MVSALFNWIDRRMPFLDFFDHHLKKYYAPANLNIWYYFGAFSLLMFINQFCTGLWLAMAYIPSAEQAFHSVEAIMRDIPYGWVLRYMHSTGASFFFIVVYLHMVRGVLYGSYKNPREFLWLVGCFLFVLLMMEAFMGYLLPWGQMSYWGAQVITSLFEAIPLIGPSLVIFIRGDYTISGVVLNRFFALHVIAIPLVFIGLIALHILALHAVGSNNPDGIEIRDNLDENGIPRDSVPFHPYYTIKDLFGCSVLLLLFFSVVFFVPEGGGFFLEAPNFQEANPMETPEHIAPVWYMTPYYAILRAVPNKLLGICAMVSSLAVWFFLPWLDRCPVRSIRYRHTIHKCNLILLGVSFVGLGILGIQPPSPWKTFFARICTTGYFAFFAFLPIYSRYEKTKPLPTRLTACH
ncbi:MAG: cytochrome bc complex cytochrome b subunit [Gammaproteobacteria bacterium]|nr:cytochrome bc complex cytochrome b subunit [Gammaproteobacteria bacterium]